MDLGTTITLMAKGKMHGHDHIPIDFVQEIWHALVTDPIFQCSMPL